MSNCTDLISIVQAIAYKVPLASILIVFSCLTVLLNSILLISFVATKQVTQNTSNILIFFISLSDLATGLIFMPIKANILLDTPSVDICVKLTILVIGNGLIIFSSGLAILIAIDRYLHMNPDLHNRQSLARKMFKRPYIFFVISFVFVISETLSLISLLDNVKSVIWNVGISFNGLFLFAIFILITVALYTRGYLRIRRVADNNPVYRESGETPEYVRSLYKTVLVLVLLVCIHSVPYFGLRLALVILFISKKPYNGLILKYAYEVSILLFNAGCFTNAMAVLYFNKKAKYWIRSKMGRSDDDGRSR